MIDVYCQECVVRGPLPMGLINQGQGVLLLYMRLIHLAEFVYGEGDAGRNITKGSKNECVPAK